MSGRPALYNLTSRTRGGRLVHLKGDKPYIGQFVDARILEYPDQGPSFGEVRNKPPVHTKKPQGGA
jgi:hypothetical protein